MKTDRIRALRWPGPAQHKYTWITEQQAHNQTHNYTSLSVYVYIHIYIYIQLTKSLSLYIYIYTCISISLFLSLSIYIYTHTHIFLYNSTRAPRWPSPAISIAYFGQISFWVDFQIGRNIYIYMYIFMPSYIQGSPGPRWPSPHIDPGPIFGLYTYLHIWPIYISTHIQ